jgi:hypothetical protein
MRDRELEIMVLVSLAYGPRTEGVMLRKLQSVIPSLARIDFENALADLVEDNRVEFDIATRRWACKEAANSKESSR